MLLIQCVENENRHPIWMAIIFEIVVPLLALPRSGSRVSDWSTPSLPGWTELPANSIVKLCLQFSREWEQVLLGPKPEIYRLSVRESHLDNFGKSSTLLSDSDDRG
jgi:hypothetical protein